MIGGRGFRFSVFGYRTQAHSGKAAVGGRRESWLRITITVALVVMWSNSLHAQSTLRDREAARIEMLERIAPSVVCVMAATGEGGGSGVLISPDGYAVSNYHVTSGSGPFMKCGLNDGRLYDAVIVGIDPTGDVALIQLQGRTDFPFAQPGNSDYVRVGQEVVALGNPFLLASDFTPTVTYGIVSGVRRYQYPADTFLEYTDCIQIDASINPGNSGGPLFDIDGRWIGINGRASFEKRGRVNTGAAYAISVNQVQLFIEHLKCGLIVDHGQTEFTVETSDDGEVIVNQVSELSEAWRRGLRPRARILSIADRVPSSANDFQNVVGIYPEGTRLPLSWQDDDGVHAATIRLKPLHAFQTAPELPEERKPNPDRGPEDKDAESSDVPAEVPQELAQLFVEQDGLCNAWFNQRQLDRVMAPLRERARERGDLAALWTVALKESASGGDRSGELTSTSTVTGVTLNGRTSVQDAADPRPEEEPGSVPGLLIAVNQLRRLLSADDSAFDERLAAGRTRHLPLELLVDVVVTRQGTTTCRWYFADGSPLPAAVDVEYAQGADEARVLFDDWADHDRAVFPGRIGVISGTPEATTWLSVDSVTVQHAESARP